MATALETASLVMVPSGYEDGTLGSLQPLDGTGDFTFTRGSNISATRVNEAGYIEKGYENLVYYSNAFDAGTIYWDVRLINSIIGGQAGYDGSNDAWRLNRIAGEEFIRSGSSSNVTNVSGVHTCSIYAKANEVEWILFGYNGIGFTYFHLSGEGSLGNNVASVLSSSIESVGNGWYRCSFTANGTPNGIYVYPANGNGDLGGTGGVYIQDAQLNQGLAAHPYLETTTTTAKGGILENMPRLDYSSGRCSLLLEPSRTNLVEYSEYFYGTGYNISDPDIIESNSATSPEGVRNASKLTINQSGSGSNKIENARSARTLSVFAKAGEELEFLFFGPTAGQGVFFNLTDGSVAGYYQGNSSNIDDAYSISYNDGWYRFVVVFSLNTYSRIFVSQNQQITFNRTAGNGIYLYGLQAEQDVAYPTSYIPTYGVSQTRLDDIATIADAINADNDFTFYFESILMYEGSTAKYFDNPVGFAYLSGYNVAGTNLRHRFAGTNYVFTASEEVFKYLIRKDSNNMKLYLNGVLVHTIANLPTGTNNLELLGGEVQKTLFFPTALSDEACIELTTL